jgi:aspartate oxidase
VAKLVVQSAAKRKESVGGHFRTDVGKGAADHGGLRRNGASGVIVDLSSVRKNVQQAPQWM